LRGPATRVASPDRDPECQIPPRQLLTIIDITRLWWYL
jgi:hypothetical protein